MKHAESNNVFEETFEGVIQNPAKLKWQYVEHKSKVLTDIYVHYITMRMRHHSYTKNQEGKKINKTKKKRVRKPFAGVLLSGLLGPGLNIGGCPGLHLYHE